jgi:hypothetical protein
MPVKFVVVVALLAGLTAGCVSFGVQCQTDRVSAFVKVHRPGWGVGKGQVANLADFRSRVCP